MTSRWLGLFVLRRAVCLGWALVEASFDVSVERDARSPVEKNLGLPAEKRKRIESQKAYRDHQEDYECNSEAQQNDGKCPLHDVAPLPCGCELSPCSLTLSADVFRIAVLVAILAFNGGTASGTDSEHIWDT
jgi:hypothetical protein